MSAAETIVCAGAREASSRSGEYRTLKTGTSLAQRQIAVGEQPCRIDVTEVEAMRVRQQGGKRLRRWTREIQTGGRPLAQWSSRWIAAMGINPCDAGHGARALARSANRAWESGRSRGVKGRA